MRVRVELPATFLFTTELPVRITDLNYGGHLGNDALLSLLHEARVRFLAHLGAVELDAASQQGFIMADVAVEYKAEAFYGDVLRFELGASDLHKYGFDLGYRVSNQAGHEVARAKTGMLCFDYATRQLRRLPEPLAGRLAPPAPLA